MKKFITLSLVAVALLAGGLSLAGHARSTPQESAPTAQLSAEALSLDTHSEISAATDAGLPLAAAAVSNVRYAVKPEAAAALTYLAISMLAALALVRGARGAKLSLTGYLRFSAGVCLAALDRMIAAVWPSFHYGRRLGVSAYTQIADLWIPQIWQQGMMERLIDTPNLLNSPLVATSPEIVQIASGPGVEANIPFLIEPNPADQVQIERTAPDITKIGSALQKCAVLNRVSPLGSTALSKAVSGADPIRAITGVIGDIRLRQRQTALLSQLSGLFGFLATPNQASGVFRGLRLDNFSETGAAPAANLLIDSDMMIDGITLMGRALERLIGGVVFMHSVIHGSLLKQNQIDVIRNSEGEIVLRQWKGLTVILDDSLVRAGGVSGKVYYTVLAAPGSIAFGEKPQVITNLPGEVAALQLDLTQVATNDVVIYDRTRYILHPQGAKWTGAPANAAGGATNAELATVGNWALAFNDVRNVGIVLIRTNG